ncbi:MAG: glycerol-3-phosphate 1-O-acyltransferase [Planctomycetaceae bacterium]|nr:glycerol-3-phosphate 1-O-acyltransferase [Planctomycetaceae bacterium]
MSTLANGVCLTLASYLIGSIPFGYVCGRLVRGIDIRQHGSGNIGATNVGRVLGGKWGLLVLALDGLKGIVPVAGLTPLLLGEPTADIAHWRVAAGIATILGHMFPCWLGFRGGKGVATSLGVVVCLGGWSTLAAAAVFAASFGIWRFVSLSSILAAVAFAVAQMIVLQPNPFSEQTWSLASFSLLVPLMIVIRHRANIARLIRGEEKPFQPSENPVGGGNNAAQ